MTKFVVVNKAPEKVDKDCVVIGEPDFYSEIEQTDAKRPKSNEITTNYLREILAKIGNKYVGEEFNAMTDVNVSKFRGRPCSTHKQVHQAVYEALERSYPKMFDKYVEYQIKNRPFGTKLVYFVGDRRHCSKFFEYGLDEVKQKDIPVVLGKAKKQAVGKPAVTDEEVKTQDSV